MQWVKNIFKKKIPIINFKNIRIGEATITTYFISKTYEHVTKFPVAITLAGDAARLTQMQVDYIKYNEIDSIDIQGKYELISGTRYYLEPRLINVYSGDKKYEISNPD